MNSNNQKGSHDVDILGWVCDELAPPQAEVVQRAAAGDPVIAQKADGLRTAFLALTSEADKNVCPTESLPGANRDTCPTDQPMPSSFTATLRQRWETELGAEQVQSSPLPRSEKTMLGRQLNCRPNRSAFWRRWLRLAIAPLAAAAAIAVFMAWPSGQSHFPPSLAWADVVSALMRVDHFHVTAFEQRPRSVDGPKMYRMDMFYQQPGKFRLQGLDRVQFISDGKITAMYDVSTKSFLRAEKIEPNRLAGFIAQFERDGLLPAVIGFVFRGTPPSAEPLKSTDADPTPGIEIFDYARDSNDRWARIWVAKESRLPIRMKLFQPESDGFMLVEFDYSDRQPAAFFDVDAFQEGLNHIDGANAERVYLIGAEPVAGKLPQGSSQIPRVQPPFWTSAGKSAEAIRADGVRLFGSKPLKLPQGSSQTHAGQVPFKPPVGQEAWAATDGDLAVKMTNPKNHGNHGELRAYPKNIRDTWSNEYLKVTELGLGYVDDQPIAMALFTPKGDFHPGSGQRRLMMDLFVEDMVEHRQGNAVSHKMERWDVGKIELVIPPADDAKMPNDAKKYLTTENKVYAFWASLESPSVPLAEKNAALERWAQVAPSSLAVRLWRVALLLEAKEPNKAWDCFARDILDESLRLDVITDSGRSNHALGRYVFHLYSTGKDQQAEQITERLKKVRAEATQDKRWRRAPFRGCFESELSWIYQAMQIPDRLKRFDAGPKPSAGQIVAGKDGFVAVELKVPGFPEWFKESPASFNMSSQAAYWTNDRTIKGGTYHSGYFVEHSKDWTGPQTIWWLLKNTQSTMTIDAKVPVVQIWYQEPTYRPWTLTIDVPAPTVDSAKAWIQDKAKVPPEQRR
jgi:hypothetical protein